MICCCSHFVGLHAQPASEGEPPGKCSKEGCECGLFEIDGPASLRPLVPASKRSLGLCGCVEIEFIDGRRGKQECAQHCLAQLAGAVGSIVQILATAQVSLGRLAELKAAKLRAAVDSENKRLLQLPPPGGRRG